LSGGISSRTIFFETEGHFSCLIQVPNFLNWRLVCGNIRTRSYAQRCEWGPRSPARPPPPVPLVLDRRMSIAMIMRAARLGAAEPSSGSFGSDRIQTRNRLNYPVFLAYYSISGPDNCLSDRAGSLGNRPRGFQLQRHPDIV